MKLQHLLSLMRQAIDEFQMIQKGDKIAVGLSGGKDSLALLYGLKYLQKFYPNNFELIAVTVDLGFKNTDFNKIKELCQKLEVPYKIIPTQIGEIIFDERKESNPCSLCSKMRKGALNQCLQELGHSKVAYGHHKEDLIETMMMSLLFEGRFHAFQPKTFLEHTQITTIRPLLYVREADIKGFCKKYQLPVCKSPCPADGHTKREYVKELIKQINMDNPGAKDCMYAAIKKQFLSEKN